MNLKINRFVIAHAFQAAGNYLYEDISCLIHNHCSGGQLDCQNRG
jgi:hypothetical protein